jgi:hypothetical protein
MKFIKRLFKKKKSYSAEYPEITVRVRFKPDGRALRYEINASGIETLDSAYMASLYLIALDKLPENVNSILQEHGHRTEAIKETVYHN